MLKKIKNKFIWLFAHNIPKSVRFNFFVDLIGSTVSGIGLGFFVPYYPLLARNQFGANELLLGIMTAGAYIGFIAALFSGGIVKPGKEKQWYCNSIIIARLLTFGAAAATGAFTYCFLISLLNGILNLFVPQYAVIIRKIYPIEFRGRLMGYVRLAGAVANLIGVGISGLMMKDPDNWRWAFAVSAFLCTASGIIFYRFRVPVDTENIPAKPDMWKHIIGSFATLGESKQNLLLFLTLPFYSFAGSIIGIVSPIFQSDILHVTPSNMSVITVMQFVFWTIGFLLWGRFIDRFTATKAFVLHAFVAVLWPLVYFFAGNWYWVIAAQSVYGFMIACNEIGFFNVKLEIAEKGKDNEYQALHSFGSGLRCFLGVVLGVYLTNMMNRYNLDIRNLYLVSGALFLVSGIFLYPLGFGKNRVVKN